MKYIIFTLALLLPLLAEAKDGQLGATSTVTVQITITIPERIVLHTNKTTNQAEPGKGTNIQFTKETVKDAKGNKVIIFMPKL